MSKVTQMLEWPEVGPRRTSPAASARRARAAARVWKVRRILRPPRASWTIAAAVFQPLEALLPFEGRTFREFYVEEFCGRAVMPIGEAGQPYPAAQGVHVPLEHQSAITGVL